MTIEGNVGADASLFSTAADQASANARAAQGSGSTADNAFTTGVAPSALSAPSSVVVAAGLVTSSSGLIDFSFDLYFTDSAADTVSIAVQEIGHATASAGGAQSGNWRYENGTTPVTVTGDAPVTIETLTKTVTTGALSASISARFATVGPIGEQVGLQIVVTAAHNLSGMVFNGFAKTL